MSILGPDFLVKQISTFAIVCAAITLVVFSNFINLKIVFPISDYLHSLFRGWFKRTKWLTESGKELVVNTLATIVVTSIFISYCYFTGTLLAEYFFEPILLKLKEYILVALIILFFLVAKAVTSRYYRRLFFE